MGAVLLLNATYEPLSIIPEQRAVALLLRERVEAATDDTLVLHGLRTFVAPAVTTVVEDATGGRAPGGCLEP